MELRIGFQSTLLCKERLHLLNHPWETFLFQSTLLCKERQKLIKIEQEEIKFQSTLLCKERRDDENTITKKDCFNPRSCARSDVKMRK